MHHIRKTVCRGLAQSAVAQRRRGRVFPGIAEGDVLHKIWHGSLTAVGNGAHISHILAGVDLVLVLADAGPRGFIGRSALQIEAAGRRFCPVKGQTACDACPVDIFRQSVGAQLGCNLRESDITGVCKRLLKILLSVDAVADNGLCADLLAALAVKGPLLDIRDVFEGGAGCHQLES